MKEQEFDKFKVENSSFLLTPRKYDIYDKPTEKLKFTGKIKGFSKLHYSLYDGEGLKVIEAQQISRNEWNVLKDNKEIASFSRYGSKRLKGGYELKTKTQIYKTEIKFGYPILNYTDESGRECLSIYQSEKERIIDVDQNFDSEIAVVVSIIIICKWLQDERASGLLFLEALSSCG